MAALVTLLQCKKHLHVEDDLHDVEITLKRDQATATIVDYLESRADPTWTDQTVPGQVSAAILLLLGNLYEHRGDDMQADEACWQAITRLLVRSRDPALA